MNIDLLMWMIFSVVLVVLLWIMPNTKINAIRKLLTSLLQVLPITKVAQAYITFLERSTNRMNDS
ncbi:hypothetical protein SAMN06265376_11085 [Dokdonia pacifica]|uniref:Uncharacterized protein n=1 Tax=Dokdonia pacifica TaxID=1627892 RepID=A0A239DC71_9FLAO|nr:hypothetical protein SAMN06265376_11085 [Dokdonia pacifica]